MKKLASVMSVPGKGRHSLVHACMISTIIPTGCCTVVVCTPPSMSKSRAKKLRKRARQAVSGTLIHGSPLRDFVLTVGHSRRRTRWYVWCAIIRKAVALS